MRTSIEKTMDSDLAEMLKFQLDCFPFIFSMEELEMLEKKGQDMQALFEGRKDPVSLEERSFVRFCKGQSGPSNIMETAWIKYLHRYQLEAALLQTEELYREYTRQRKH